MPSKLSNISIFGLLLKLYLLSVLISILLYTIFFGSNKMFFVTCLIDLGLYTVLSFTLLLLKKYFQFVNSMFGYFIFSVLFYIYFIRFLIESFTQININTWKVLESGKKIHRVETIYSFEENIGSFKAKLLCSIVFFILQLLFWIILNRKILKDQ